MLDFPTIKAKLSSQCPIRSSDAGAGEASVALILSPIPSGGLETLFIKRAKQEQDPWSGQVGLPGGHKEPEDADLLHTALRETREEIGIRLSPQDLLGELDDLRPDWQGLPSLNIRPFVFGIKGRPHLKTSREVQSAFWAGLDSLYDSEKSIRTRGGLVRVPVYKVRRHVVWGITRRIIAAFLARSL
ncbi:MAG: CoA pyrophosphatase [Elusimicrobiota bacterium]